MKKATVAKESRKNKILQALLNSKDITEASQMAGVSRKTIYSYLKDAEFIRAYQNLKQTEFREMAEKISKGADASTDFFLSIIRDETAACNLKIQAGAKFLDFYLKTLNVENTMNEAIIKENSDPFDLGSLFG